MNKKKFVNVLYFLLYQFLYRNIDGEMTRNYKRTKEQQYVKGFLGILFTFITSMNSSMSFYIFTLTGQIFRDELKQLFFF
jgi:hypothetical protein